MKRLAHCLDEICNDGAPGIVTLEDGNVIACQSIHECILHRGGSALVLAIDTTGRKLPIHSSEVVDVTRT